MPAAESGGRAAIRLPVPPVPPWRTALTAALQRGSKAPEARYVQLATVDAGSGLPRNRSVVFRGFGPASELLVLTDARSRKMTELRTQPGAEVCWYLAATREQFRLRVHCQPHGSDASGDWGRLRHDLWQARGARGQAEWLGAVPAEALTTAVDDFVLLACTVQHAEHLQLRTDPHTETVWRLSDQGWVTQVLRGG